MPTTTYTFDSSTEGWRIWNATTQSFETISGINFSQSSFDGGVLQYGDTGGNAGIDAYLSTPTDFSGDQRALVGGDVSFRFRNQDTQSFTPDATISSVEVILVSNSGTTITATVPITPTTGLVDFTANVSLDAATFGVSQSVFDSVLGDLSHFGIDGNSRALNENTVIDTVTFTPSATPNGAVDGTGGDDNMPNGFVDENGDAINNSANDIRGYAGNDTIDGGGGNDTIDGGTGNDNITGGTGNDSIIGGTGNDTLTGFDGNDTLIGGAGDDYLDVKDGSSSGFESGGSSTDAVYGGDGNDTIEGGFGSNETIDGGADNDTLSYRTTGNGTPLTANLTTGTYSLGSGAGSGSLISIENIEGTFGNDNITGDGNANRLTGGFNGAGNDTITGLAGDDTLEGGLGNDSLHGGDDDDLVAGGQGIDTMDGGAGEDTVSYADAFGGTETVDLDLAAGTGTIRASDGTLIAVETAVNFEHAIGGDNGDSISGTSGDNSLDGGAGNDSLEGLGGNDTLVGGTGNDTLVGGDGRDSLEGGTGDDLINTFSGSSSGHEANGDNVASADTVDAGAGDDTIIGGFGVGEVIDGGADTDLLDFGNLSAGSAINIDLSAGTYTLGTGGTGTVTNVENLSGTLGDDTILGDGNDNVLTGGGPSGNGDDSISGGGGNDTIDGGIGADTITGGAGSDRMTGGAGDDLFILADGFGQDTITDFDVGDDDSDGRFNDQLDVSGLTDASGNPINTADVTVVDDGFGNARLNFPNGEYLILEGVSPSQIDSGTELFSAGIPCFTQGTWIKTPSGEVAVEDLRVGDLVSTMDAGAQPITWIGQRSLGDDQLRGGSKHRPIRIPQGVLGNYAPLYVSPQHGMLLDRSHGLDQPAFVRAKHLAEVSDSVEIDRNCRSVTYFHLMCAQHQVLFANGAPTESFYPGFEGLRAFSLINLASLMRVLPGLFTNRPEVFYGPKAREFLRRKDVIRLTKSKPLIQNALSFA